MSSSEQPVQFPALVIDGSGTSTFVGVLGNDGTWLASAQSGSAPLESLFPTAEQVLKDAEFELSSIRSYIYSEGPGSVLGLRLCAMAIETWSRLSPEAAQLLAYNSLKLAAANLIDTNPELQNATIVSDWKKTAWNAVKITDGTIGSSEPIPSEELQGLTENVYHLPARKGWQEAPAGAQTISSTPESLPSLLKTPKLLRQTESVELYSSGANTFQKWTPERHRKEKAET